MLQTESTVHLGTRNAARVCHIQSFSAGLKNGVCRYCTAQMVMAKVRQADDDEEETLKSAADNVMLKMNSSCTQKEPSKCSRSVLIAMCDYLSLLTQMSAETPWLNRQKVARSSFAEAREEDTYGDWPPTLL
jgi:hypothetical protein